MDKQWKKFIDSLNLIEQLGWSHGLVWTKNQQNNNNNNNNNFEKDFFKFMNSIETSSL